MGKVSYSWNEYDPQLRRRAYAATAAAQGVLLFLLLWFCFETPLPLPGEEGIDVMFGAETAGRQSAPVVAQRQEPVPPTPAVDRTADRQEQLTQDFEDAPEVVAATYTA